MNIKHLFLTLIISSFFSQAYCMQEDLQDNNGTYNTDGMAPESE